MKQLLNQKMLLNHSLFSSKEYKLDNSGNIEITKYSLLHTKSHLFPLDLINPEPMVEHKPESQHLLFSLSALFSAAVFFIISQTIQLPWLNIFSAVFILFSSFSFFYALKNRKTIYSFFFENTKTKIFSIEKTHNQHSGKEQSLSQSDTFIENLRKVILEKNTQSNLAHSHTNRFDTKEEKIDFLQAKLNDIYNYGVVNDTVYSIIENNIREKICDKQKSNISTKNIISFTSKKEMMETA